jgi:glucose-1-phosphate thymidylyltransferase
MIQDVINPGIGFINHLSEKMKGVILAGGTGTRLRPLTEVTNKHLLPVFDSPMIVHPLKTLKQMGIKDICIVTGGEYMADFMRFLGSGSRFKVRLTYKIQDGPLGIAHALLQAEDFFGKEKVVAILGDNIFEKVSVPRNAFEDDYAYIFLKKVSRPERFGVAIFDSTGQIIGIEEKPKVPKSDYAVTGLYIYPNDVFDFIKTLKPSARGELEITDVNNWYLKQNRLKAIKLNGFWTDAGTFPSLLKANILRAALTNPVILGRANIKEILEDLF